jgi:RNA polymerase subunit RPABC4/transcription elongation factor Spt4
MIENISSLIVAAASLCGGIVAALLAGITIWTFRDIRARTRDPFVQILATVMVGVIPIAGILVYFMLRPRETLAEQYVRALEEESLLASIENQEFCPTCGRRVDPDMLFCPSCHTKLRNTCPACGRSVHLSWDLCPYCGQELIPELPKAAVGAPQAKPAPKPQLAKPNVLERVGDMVERVAARLAQPATNARAEDMHVTPPPAPSSAARPAPTPSAMRSSPPLGNLPPQPARRPPPRREELE